MISVITATFNKLELTHSFWESLRNYPPSGEWEMIWVDDGSTDGTRDWLRSLPPDGNRIIFNERNLGYSTSNNIGASMAQGDILAFLNNDLVLTPDWSAPLLSALSDIYNIGVVGNVQINPATRRVDHAGVKFELSGLPFHYRNGFNPNIITGKGDFHYAVTAACWLVKKSTFLKFGGFSTKYRNGLEDVDLCLRLGQSGYRHWVSYESQIFHHVSSSPGRHKYNQRNLAIFLNQWGGCAAEFGKKDWPMFYLKKSMNNPLDANYFKVIDALLLLIKVKRGISSWARKRQDSLITYLNANVDSK